MFKLETVATKAKDFILAAVRAMSDDERRQLALKIIDKGYGWVVAHNLTLFKGLGLGVASALIAERKNHAGQVLRGLAAFGLSEDEKRWLMYYCVEQGQAWAVQEAVRELPLDSGFARHLIANGCERFVGEHLALFKGYTETQFHEDRFAWQASFDLRRAPGHRYKA